MSVARLSQYPEAWLGFGIEDRTGRHLGSMYMLVKKIILFLFGGGGAGLAGAVEQEGEAELGTWQSAPRRWRLTGGIQYER
jgi:hypothetical protein